MKTVPLTTIILFALGACTADKPPAAADSTAAVSNATTIDTGTAATPPAGAATPTPRAPASPKAERWEVSEGGIGPVKVGMSVKTANTLLGEGLAVPAKLQQCDYVRPKATPKYLAFMVEKNEITRIEVQGGSDISTVDGARIGDSEERIKTLYPGQVEVRPAKYGSGHTLVVTPKGGGNYRIVFETDGTKVTKYRSGRLPAVEYVEGCG